jgi:hypothetical protein
MKKGTRVKILSSPGLAPCWWDKIAIFDSMGEDGEYIVNFDEYTLHLWEHELEVL